MNGAGAERSGGGVVGCAGGEKTGLSGSRLIVTRVLWLALVILALALFVASLPAYVAQLQRPCLDARTCNLAGALSARGLQELSALGLSTQSYAVLLAVFFAMIVAIWSGIGFLIFWRRANDWFALFTAFFLVMFNTTYPDFPITALAIAHPALNGLITVLGALGLPSVVVFLFLFPNGRLAPRWMGFVLAFGVLGTISSILPEAFVISNNWPGWLQTLLNLSTYLAVIVSQVYRYRRVSTRTERQQTKWVVYGIVIAMVGISVIPAIPALFLPAVFNQPNTPYNVLPGLITYPVVLLALPITIGIAILRSRLYDIDVLINRTLVYGALTILLTALYLGLILGLESLARAITGKSGESPVIITVSTLAIVWLIRPLRRRLQTTIDRRFYRRKYDASRTLAAFSATLRSEVDLNDLCAHLSAVVQETMQPAHVSLWLRPSEPLARRQVDARQ